MESIADDFNIDTEEWGIKMDDDGNTVPKDVSDNFQFEYKIEITCANEREQEQMFNEMQERGYKCRILTL